MIYVFRDGCMVPKGAPRPRPIPDFPTPIIGRPMQPYESPISGVAINSWRERDAEMKEHNCYDHRDMSESHVYPRSVARSGEDNGGSEQQLDFKWGDTA